MAASSECGERNQGCGSGISPASDSSCSPTFRRINQKRLNDLAAIPLPLPEKERDT